MKAKVASEVTRFVDIPNVGPRIEADFRSLDIHVPTQLQNRDPYELYRTLCKLTGSRQDPCVLDTFMAAVDFMNGAPARPWWEYTLLRKKMHSDI